MNGSKSALGMPANARRTGKPSPSYACGAFVIIFTERGCAPGATKTLGKVKVSAVTAGIAASSGLVECSTNLSLRAYGRFRKT